ncbi:sugar phosphate isomerase [Paenibacillus selenitireducens]|uniref:Sugar phosphate isomerase n=1 Tax=Paenibacillus selenitireducens TaxID=1324314 RepID=A0A1T2XKR2_9BACL|nr:sugar phosphate isomerase/epimerase family protein [Paenibacillus selenitireducens]OPA80461.1 sugar phosphate isomerase [Paenibacillus selenitireducens]
MIKIGLQLYTLREETSRDFVGTLRKVAALGYQGVEFAGYGGLTAEEMKSLLDELNLVSIGAHVGIERLRDHLDEEIEYHKVLGTKYIACPWLGDEYRESVVKLMEVTKVLKEASARLAQHGIELGYHNHDFEFTNQFGGKTMFDTIFELTAPAPLFAELDVCWVHFGGYDPSEYMMKYAGRAPLIHLKDVRQNEDGSPQTVILGEGDMDLDEVVKTAKLTGVEWFIVEQDVCQIDPIESITQSMAWVRNNVK